VEVNSKKGEGLVKGRLFVKTDQKPKPKADSRQPDAILFDPLRVSQLIEKSRNSKVWKELGRTCLNCGICTYVCPLCYCFTMTDKISASGDSCQRCRRWDACTLASFSKISGGYNFRPEPQDRLYNWFYHKFVRAPKERGKIDCIGCHRCIDFCPVGINFYKVIQQLAKEQRDV
jgi:ferredoxin